MRVSRRARNRRGSRDKESGLLKSIVKQPVFARQSVSFVAFVRSLRRFYNTLLLRYIVNLFSKRGRARLIRKEARRMVIAVSFDR